MAHVSNFLKTLFWLLLIIQFAPFLIISIKKQYRALLEPHSKVGLITMTGMLTDAEFYSKHIQQFFKDNEIKAVVIYMKNGMGGVAGTAQALYQELRDLKKEHVKPVFTFVENSCVSAHYYVALASDMIIATPSSFIGSIGVYIPQPKLKEFIEQFKISYDVTKSGSYKTVGDPFLATTPEGQALLQSLTNDTYDQFVHDAVQSRPMLLPAKSKEWADGKIFTGRQAKEIHLIDEIGSFVTLERILRQKVALEGRIEWVKPHKTSTIAQFFGATDDSYDSSSYIETACNTIMQCIRATFLSQS